MKLTAPAVAVGNEALESENKFRSLFDSISDALFIVDMDGYFLRVNRSACERLGYSHEELLRLCRSDIDFPQFAAEILEQIKTITKRGLIVFESIQISKTGNVIPVELNCKLIDFGNKPAILVVARDISERKQIENALHESEQLLNDSQIITGVGSYVVDIHSGFWKSSGVLDKIFGIDETYERSVRGWESLIYPDDRKSLSEYFKNDVLGQRVNFNKEYRIIRHNDRAVRWIHGLGKLEFDGNGSPVRMFGTIQDITERKLSEQQLHELTGHIQFVREEEKTVIAREIHDELGGTLTSIKMEAHALKSDVLEKRDAALLIGHIDEISKLIDHAMGFTRQIITGLHPTILDDLGILAALEWKAEQFQNRSGIVCQVNCVCREHEILAKKLDQSRSIALFRIAQEALTNVVRHSGASRVEIEFHHGEDEIVMSVIDNGCGMTEASTSASRHFGILGMRERAKQLGGEIILDTPAGGGFDVTVILPLVTK